MLAWSCASASFWCGAGLLGLLAVVEACTAVRSLRGPRSLPVGRRSGEPAR